MAGSVREQITGVPMRVFLCAFLALTDSCRVSSSSSFAILQVAITFVH